MATPRSEPFNNHLLTRLSADDLALLTPHLKAAPLAVSQVLEVPNAAIDTIYFPESGLVSAVAVSAQRRVETGMIGYEGMTGIPVVMGNDRSPNLMLVQLEGEAHAIGSAELRTAMERSGTLHGALLHHAQAFMAQTTHTALANGCANIEQRLARWLLMAHDRSEGNLLPLTHEFISMMLSVRRSGVTVALHALEGLQLIQSVRGSIMVTDRFGLEHFAGSHYGIPEKEYLRLLQWSPQQRHFAPPGKVH